MRLPFALLYLLLVFPAYLPVQAAPAPALVAPGNGVVRALTVGIDRYRNVTGLKGAVADARDIEQALRTMGAKDITLLTDEQADRASVLQALDRLVARTQPGDLVVVSIAGHGSKEDEHVKGSSPDGTDEVFLLVGFDPKTAPGGSEKILNHEFHHYLRALEGRGAEVIFVADTCYGGGLAREIAPGGVEMSYRQVPRYRLADDDFKPVSTTADAFLTALDFDRTTFLAAVDSQTKAPEVMIGGRYRGALSYAIARAIEGAADEKRDGKTTLRELFGYARKIVYQLSDERQTIVTEESPQRNLDTDVVLEFRSAGQTAPAQPPKVEAAPPPRLAKAPLKLATTGLRPDRLSDVSPLLTPFEVVGLEANPDIVWDPVSREAIAGGDKIALAVDRLDLPGVVDRTAAVRDIKDLVVRAPQTLHVLPDASLHRQGSKIEVEIGEIARRSLILIDITGSGTLQLIYPTGREPPGVDRGSLRIPFQVRDPYGADVVVAITSEQRMTDLEAALKLLHGRKSAGQVTGAITRFAPNDARIGVVGLFTVP